MILDFYSLPKNVRDIEKNKTNLDGSFAEIKKRESRSLLDKCQTILVGSGIVPASLNPRFMVL